MIKTAIAKLIITIFGIFLLLLTPFISNGADAYKGFIMKQYPSNNFSVSQADIHHGDVFIKVIEAKRLERHAESPHFCRTWLFVNKGNRAIYKKYFDNIEAVGFSYGLFIPKVQPPYPYFTVVKNGDYDGRLFIVHKDGKVFDLLGGFYFITENKRYIFSHYASDTSGLAIFDLRTGRVVFSSVDVPAYQHQWYTNNGTYFFTASEWTDKSGMAHETKGIAYFYDFKTHKIKEKSMSNSELAASKPVEYDFDPREYEDCKATQIKTKRNRDDDKKSK
ncbi:MAG: hypothetical protein EPN23_11125 [Verrucomicrobia bacterium]|nr:MAG: hypothetical protein EPN23_11125 [Verrucomicrobiota bacterium]